MPQVSLFRGAVVTDVVINVDSKFRFRFTENKNYEMIFLKIKNA